MTDFPSTTTDPALLAAIGQAAGQEKQARRRSRRAASGGPRRGRTTDASGPRDGRRRPFAARLMRALVGLILMLVSLGLFVTVVPAMLTNILESLATAAAPSTGSDPMSTAAPAPTPSGNVTSKPSAKATATKVPATRPHPKPKPNPAVPALAPTDCARATGTEVAKVLGRKVQPVVVSRGCAWGTRLDDPSTVIVSIQMSANHNSYDTQLEASAKQRRIVYGTAYGPRYRPATALWVATGQPISTGSGHVRAVADTHIVISTTELGLTDDQARRKALAIAAALNN